MITSVFYDSTLDNQDFLIMIKEEKSSLKSHKVNEEKSHLSQNPYMYTLFIDKARKKEKN